MGSMLPYISIYSSTMDPSWDTSYWCSFSDNLAMIPIWELRCGISKMKRCAAGKSPSHSMPQLLVDQFPMNTASFPQCEAPKIDKLV